jgi:hypothetical protein
MVTLTHTYTVPYMTYQWVPAVTHQAPILSAGVSPALAAPSLLTGVSAAPAGLAVGFNAVQAAPAFGLGAAPVVQGAAFGVPAGAAPAAPAESDAQLFRTMLARALAAGPDKSTGGPAAAPPAAPPAAPASAQDCEARLRKLTADIASLNTKIDNEIRKLRDDMTDTDAQLAGLINNNTDKINDVDKRQKEIETNAKIKELLGK